MDGEEEEALDKIKFKCNATPGRKRVEILGAEWRKEEGGLNMKFGYNATFLLKRVEILRERRVLEYKILASCLYFDFRDANKNDKNFWIRIYRYIEFCLHGVYQHDVYQVYLLFL